MTFIHYSIQMWMHDQSKAFMSEQLYTYCQCLCYCSVYQIVNLKICRNVPQSNTSQAIHMIWRMILMYNYEVLLKWNYTQQFPCNSHMAQYWPHKDLLVMVKHTTCTKYSVVHLNTVNLFMVKKWQGWVLSSVVKLKSAVNIWFKPSK